MYGAKGAFHIIRFPIIHVNNIDGKCSSEQSSETLTPYQSLLHAVIAPTWRATGHHQPQQLARPTPP